jgi:nitrogen fixation-related uncharacterized protein
MFKYFIQKGFTGMLVGWKRGQVWSYDLIVASIIFVIALSILAFFWWSVRTNLAEDKEAIVRESLKVSDVLMSPGIPENWNDLVNLSDSTTWSQVEQIGLAQSWDNHSLSVDKVYKLINMSSANYSYVQNRLRSNYNFYMEFKFRNTSNNNGEQPLLMNNSPIFAGIDKVYNNDSTVKALARDDRIAVYNNSIVIMRLYLWSDSTYD